MASTGVPGARAASDDRTTSGTGLLDLLRVLAVPLVAMAMLGVLFAATQTALTVFATGTGHPSGGGLLYAVMAVSSAVSAALMTRLPARFSARLRVAVAATGLLAGVAAMLAAAAGHSLIVMVLAVLVTGVWVSPALITLNSIVGALAPAPRMALAMGLLSSSVVTGVALGAATAGALADKFGVAGAFGTAAAAVGLLVGTAAAMPRPDLTR